MILLFLFIQDRLPERYARACIGIAENYDM